MSDESFSKKGKREKSIPLFQTSSQILARDEEKPTRS
jgi:hypothetical protein